MHFITSALLLSSITLGMSFSAQFLKPSLCDINKCLGSYHPKLLAFKSSLSLSVVRILLASLELTQRPNFTIFVSYLNWSEPLSTMFRISSDGGS